MKIAYLLGSLGRGGTETLLLDVFKNLTTIQFQAIGFYRKSGGLENEFLKTKMPIIFLPFRKNYLAYIRILRKKLLENKISVVHAQQPIDAFSAILACCCTSIPVVLTLHGYDYNLSLLGKIFLRLTLPFSKKNIYVSNLQKEYYTEKYKLVKSKQVSVYNGISFEKFESTPKANIIEKSGYILRNELQLKPGTLILGSVGNFNAVRNQITLCRFINKLKDKIENFQFIFVGGWVNNNKHYYDECRIYCEDNNLSSFVTFLGARNDVPLLLSQLDAFLYASDYDTFGIGVVEAMAAQIPVFVNDWGVMKEITVNGKYATLYKTKDENDLLKQFMLFLHDKSQFIQKAIDAKAFVKEKYSIEHHIDCLKYEYEDLIIE